MLLPTFHVTVGRGSLVDGFYQGRCGGKSYRLWGFWQLLLLSRYQ